MTTFANDDARLVIDEILDRAEVLETRLDVDMVDANNGIWVRKQPSPTGVKRLTITFVERKPEPERLAEERSKRQTAALPPGHEVAKREALPDDPTAILEEAETDVYREVLQGEVDRMAERVGWPAEQYRR